MHFCPPGCLAMPLKRSPHSAADNTLSHPDWGDLRVFLAAATHGTSAAAQLLGMDVTTVRRRMASLERAIGLPLLIKNGGSFRLTAEGERVRAIAANMEALGRELSREATDAAREIEGSVRISTMEGFGSAFLAPRLGAFLEMHPRLSVQLVTAAHIANLAEREADVSINMVRPNAGRLVTRRLCQFGVGLYASKSYLQRHGVPRSLDALSKHLFVTYVDELVSVPQVKWLSGITPSPRKRLTCTSLVAQFEAVQSGAGLAMLPHFLAARSDALQRLLPQSASLVRDWWLVLHQDLQKVPRIRLAVDYLVEIVKRDEGVLLGRPGSQS